MSFIRWQSQPVQMILGSKWMCCLEHPWRSILKLKMGRGTHRETRLVHIGFSVSCPYSGSWSAPQSLLCVLGTLWTQPTPGIIKIPKTQLNQDQYVFLSSFESLVHFGYYSRVHFGFRNVHNLMHKMGSDDFIWPLDHWSKVVMIFDPEKAHCIHVLIEPR